MICPHHSLLYSYQSWKVLFIVLPASLPPLLSNPLGTLLDALLCHVGVLGTSRSSPHHHFFLTHLYMWGHISIWRCTSLWASFLKCVIRPLRLWLPQTKRALLECVCVCVFVCVVFCPWVESLFVGRHTAHSLVNLYLLQGKNKGIYTFLPSFPTLCSELSRVFSSSYA